MALIFFAGAWFLLSFATASPFDWTGRGSVPEETATDFLLFYTKREEKLMCNKRRKI
jgi:hypothetical protein